MTAETAAECPERQAIRGRCPARGKTGHRAAATLAHRMCGRPWAACPDPLTAVSRPSRLPARRIGLGGQLPPACTGRALRRRGERRTK